MLIFIKILDKFKPTILLNRRKSDINNIPPPASVSTDCLIQSSSTTTPITNSDQISDSNFKKEHAFHLQLNSTKLLRSAMKVKQLRTDDITPPASVSTDCSIQSSSTTTPISNSDQISYSNFKKEQSSSTTTPITNSDQIPDSNFKKEHPFHLQLNSTTLLRSAMKVKQLRTDFIRYLHTRGESFQIIEKYVNLIYVCNSVDFVCEEEFGVKEQRIELIRELSRSGKTFDEIEKFIWTVLDNEAN
jgi:uncharacterized protein YbcV (DUF1398 family)